METYKVVNIEDNQVEQLYPEVTVTAVMDPYWAAELDKCSYRVGNTCKFKGPHCLTTCDLKNKPE